MNQKTLRILFISVLSFGLMSSGLSQGIGTISGKVKDASTGEGLAFANVLIVETTSGVTTDLDGNYEVEIAPGTYTLQYTYIGYQKVEKQVTVKANETLIVNVELNSGSQLDEVVVSVQVRGQMAAVFKQLSSNKIVNVISSEKMQELPDANAAESIGRLPGISLQRSSGEANKVVIRGVGPAQNNVTIGGVRMASTNAGDRSADLSLIQGEMLSGVEVSKTLRADMDASAIGGTVDLQLATAKEEPTFNAMSEIAYNDLLSTIGDTKTSVGGSFRFLKKKFGIKAQGTYQQKQLSSHRFGAGYSGPVLRQELDSEGNLTGEESYISRTLGANLNLVNTTRERMGLSMVLDFKSDIYDVKFLSLINKSTDDVINRGEQYDFTSARNPFALRASSGVFEMLNTTYLVENKLRFLGTEFNLSLSHTYAKTDGLNYIFPFLENSTTAPNIDQELLIFAQPEDILNQYGGTNIADNNLRTDDINNSELTDKNYDLDFDWRIPFKLENLGIKGVFSIGGKYHLLERVSDQEQRFVDYRAGRGQGTRSPYLDLFPWVDWPAGNLQGVPASNFIDPNYNPGQFIDGTYTLTWSPDINLMKDMQSQLLESLPALFNSRGNESYRNDYSNREEQLAAYIMAELNIGNLLLVPGIRTEKVNTQYDAFAILTNPVNTNGVTGIPDSVSAKRNNHLYFPSINAKYIINESVALRGAVYKSVARPNFIDLSPRTIVDPNSTSFQSRNPFLEPSTAWNYDISLEVYNSKFGLLTINPFYKRIDNFINNLPNYFPLRNDRIRGAPDGFVESLPATDFYPINDLENSSETVIPINNPEKAEYIGVELSWSKNFGLSENKFLRGIVFDINLTFIDSRARYPYFEDIVVGIDSSGFFPKDIPGYEYNTRGGKMVSQPSFISNFILGWDHKGFSARVSYRFQGRTLNGLDARFSFADAFIDEFQLMDISLKQRIFKGFHVYLNATNLTKHVDENFRIYPGNIRLPVSNQFYGSRVQLGAMYRL
jgi:TonB-dependent receptor